MSRGPVAPTDARLITILRQVQRERGFTGPDSTATLDDTLIFANAVRTAWIAAGATPEQLQAAASTWVTGVLQQPRLPPSFADVAARAIAEAFGYELRIDRSSGEPRCFFIQRPAAS